MRSAGWGLANARHLGDTDRRDASFNFGFRNSNVENAPRSCAQRGGVPPTRGIAQVHTAPCGCRLDAKEIQLDGEPVGVVGTDEVVVAFGQRYLLPLSNRSLPGAFSDLTPGRRSATDTIRPRRRALERRGGPEHGGFVPAPTDDLEAHRQAVLREAAGDGDRGQPGERDGVGQEEPLRIVRERLSVDFRWVRLLHRKRLHGHRGQDEEIVPLEEHPHPMPQECPQLLPAADLLRRERKALLDVPNQSLLHLVAPLRQLVRVECRHHESSRREDDLVRLREVRRRGFDSRPDGSEDAGAPLRHRSDLAIHGDEPGEVGRPRNAPSLHRRLPHGFHELAGCPPR